jgi:protein TorT
MHLGKLVLGAIAAAFLALAAAPADAGDSWSFPVVCRDDPTDLWSPQSDCGDFASLESSDITKQWNLCVVYPHVKDPLYLAYTYGARQEAERLGFKLVSFEAGGYEHLDKQISQMEDCVAQGADAVFPFAISTTGLNKTIAEFRKQGIIVYDLGNGVETEVDGRSVLTYKVAGITTGKYVAKRHPKGSGEAQVVFFPGPAGVSWAESAAQGFKEGIEGSDLNLVQVMYGAIERGTQLKLVEDALQAFPDLDYAIGNTQAVEVALNLARERGKKIDVMAYYLSPGTEAGVRNGTMLATLTDNATMLMKVAINGALKVLEGKEEYVDAVPGFAVLDKDSIKDYDPLTSVAPAGWRPVFNYTPGD